MKGVILAINPSAKVVDITHQVPAGSIQEGATIIKEAYEWFPKGTIHLGVVDPGVGGKRRPILVSVDNHFFVGPDNGLFWPIIELQREIDIIELTEKKYWLTDISSTFHGRDIFAPVSAHLSLKIDPFLFGERISHPTTLDYPIPYETNNELIGHVIRIDRFGNLITNIAEDKLRAFTASKDFVIKVGKIVLIKTSHSYSDTPKGEPLALIGSSNLLEIAINMGRASDYLNEECGYGTKIIVELTQVVRLKVPP
jgi:S-adenosylmethionine hydrolase